MKETVESLLKKNAKLKCKLSKIYQGRVTTVISVAAFIAVGFIIELCFNQVKNGSKGSE